MPNDQQEPATPDLVEAAQRMMALSQRALALSPKMQERMVAQATGSEYALMDAATLGKAYTAFWAGLMGDPAKLWSAQMRATTGLAQVWAAMLTGKAGSDDAPRDRRFADKSWSEDPVARSFRDAFLVFEDTVGSLLDDLAKGDRDHLRVSFFTRQALSALSPANYLATNPAAREHALETGGQSVLDGVENLLNDLERGEGRLDIATNDAQAYDVGKDIATTEGEVVFQNELIQLIQYHPRTEKQHRVPILFVPAWINKFYILDLQPKNSLIRYALDEGHTVFVISWVNPTKEHADLDFTDYMRLGPLAALDAMREITGEKKANILGFCIGGILVTSMLGYLAGKRDDRIASATTLATMVDFEDVGEIGVFIDENRLELLREHMAETGYLEAYHLQDMFSMLRENDLIWSFYDRNYLRGNKPRAFDLLYWNSDSTRLPRAMLLWYLEQVYLQNKLRQPGGLEMDGVKIDIGKVKTPCFILATKEDHIAPWTSIYPATRLLGGEVEFVLGGSGHIAGVINPPGKRMKYGYRTADKYPKTADGFLAKAKEHEGSWWPHWIDWLKPHSGDMVKARKPDKRKSLEPAPGSFVMAR